MRSIYRVPSANFFPILARHLVNCSGVISPMPFQVEHFVAGDVLKFQTIPRRLYDTGSPVARLKEARRLTAGLMILPRHPKALLCEAFDV
jgi:hypothetical protein